jgi:hypothetical protein
MKNSTKARGSRAADAKNILLVNEKPKGMPGKLQPTGLAEHPVSG